MSEHIGLEIKVTAFVCDRSHQLEFQSGNDYHGTAHFRFLNAEKKFPCGRGEAVRAKGGG